MKNKAQIFKIAVITILTMALLCINLNTENSNILAKTLYSADMTLNGVKSVEESAGDSQKETESSLETETETTTQNPTTESPTETETVAPKYEIVNELYKIRISDGVLVKFLGDAEDKTITKIIIPKQVTYIKKETFKDYKYIKKVSFEEGSNLSKIGESAFANCTGLTKITFPLGLTKIYDYAFYNCRSLTKISIPATVTQIGEKSFAYCRSATKVTLRTGLETIGKMAFGKCTSLSEITIPKTVTTAQEIFGKTCTVSEVSFASGTKKIPDKIFKYATSIETINLPTSVVSVGQESFMGCTGITKVSLPEATTTIGSGAFRECKSLKSMTLRRSIISIGNNAFKDDDALTLKVYANSYGRGYARSNGLNWTYTTSEENRRSLSRATNKKLKSIVETKKTQFKLKYLTDYVPQGVCVIGKYVVVSAYQKNLAAASILMVYKKSNGEFVKKIYLPSIDHVGSVTNVEGRLVIGINNISITDYVAVINYSKLKKAKNNSRIKYDYCLKLPGYTDFAAYDGSIFWAGHSANISYATMYGYKVTIKKKKLVFTKKYVYTVPPNTQGLIAKKGSGGNRTFIFSQSYGVIADSHIYVYKTNIKSNTGLGAPESTYRLPSMLEGITLKDKNIYMVFESGAGKYTWNPEYSSEIKIKNIYKINYKNLYKLYSE